MFSTAMSFLGLSLVVVSLWFIYCNHRTCNQRLAILNMMGEYRKKNEIWRHWQTQFDSVSYTQHLRCLLLFGNPWKLYSAKKQ